MRTLALLSLCLLFPACASSDGYDVASLNDRTERSTYYRNLNLRRAGLTNALDRDLNNITTFIDRHFFNYSVDDPYVNFPTRSSRIGKSGGFVLDELIVTPLWYPVEFVQGLFD